MITAIQTSPSRRLPLRTTGRAALEQGAVVVNAYESVEAGARRRRSLQSSCRSSFKSSLASSLRRSASPTCRSGRQPFSWRLPCTSPAWWNCCGEGLLLGEPVTGGAGQDQGDPLVLRHPGLVGFPLDQGNHVGGDADGFDGGLLFGHGEDGSAYAIRKCDSVCAINKSASRCATTQAPYSRSCVL